MDIFKINLIQDYVYNHSDLIFGREYRIVKCDDLTDWDRGDTVIITDNVLTSKIIRNTKNGYWIHPYEMYDYGMVFVLLEYEL